MGPQKADGSRISGVASSDKRLTGVVTLKDSSTPALEKAVIVDRKGAFSFDTEGLTPPFMLKAEVAAKDSAEPVATSLHAVSSGGTANINPLTEALVAGAAGEEAAAVYQDAPVAKRKETAANLASLSDELLQIIKPLLDEYQVTDPVSGSTADSGMNALLRDVSITVAGGYLFVVNKATGGLIYAGPSDDPTAGKFYPENMPPPPSNLRIAAPDPVVSAPAPTPSPDPVSTPTPTPTPTPTAAPTAAPVPAPSTCQYTYATWSACQPTGTQTRTVLVASPSGCVGTPVVEQACTFVPAACTYTYTGWSACQSNNIQTRAVTSSSPDACVGNPVVTQACTYVPTVSSSTLYPPDMTAVKATQPSMSEPALLGSVTFSDLGTTVTRASDSKHHYAKDSVWNADESLALTNDGKVLNGQTYAYVRTLTFPSGTEHKTWANTLANKNLIFGAVRDSRQWMRMDASTGSATIIKTYSAADVGLSSLSKVSYGLYEGNMDNGDTAAALVADGVRPFIITPASGAVRCYVRSGGGYGGTISDATMSQDGKYMLVNWDGYGVDAYNAADCTFARKLTARNSHYDACVSTAGEQVVVQPGNSSDLVMTRISDGTQRQVFDDSAMRAHVSCRNVNRPGYVYVSVGYGTCDSVQTGMTAFHRLFAVKLDGTQSVEMFAWDHTPCPSTYDQDPTAVPSRNGARMWWKTNWNGTSSGVHSFVAQKR